MKTKNFILPMVCCLPFLGSCSMLQTASNKLWGNNSVASINKPTETPDALYQQGRYFQGQQRYEQAIAAYRKALLADPGFVEARNGLGVIYATQGRHDEAIKEFRAAIKLVPNAAHLYNNLGHALYLQGEYAAAVATLEHAIILAPDNPGTLSNLNLAYAKVGNPGYAPPTSAASNASATGTSEQAPWQPLAKPNNSQGLIQTEPQGQLETVQLAPNLYEIRERTTPPQIAKQESNTQTKAEPVHTGKLHLEVSNGNGMNGFAKKVSQYLGDKGYKTLRLTNQKPYQVTVSQIQYRPGFRDEAQRLQSNLPEKTELVQNDKLRQNIQARLLLGKDLAIHVAQFESKAKVLVASNNPAQDKNSNTKK